jgi:hypothetical protein
MDRNVRTVLEVLYPLGVGMENDIANPLRQLFPITSRADPNLPHQIGLLQRFLKYLVDDNMLHIEDKSSYMSLGLDHPEGGKRYLDGTWPVSAAMTLKAYEQYEKMLERGRGEDLDSSVRLTNRVSRRLTRVTVGVSIGALLISGFAIFKDNILPTEKSPIPVLQEIDSTLQNNQQRLDSLHRNLHEIRETLKSLKGDVSSAGTPKTPPKPAVDKK